MNNPIRSGRKKLRWWLLWFAPLKFVSMGYNSPGGPVMYMYDDDDGAGGGGQYTVDGDGGFFGDGGGGDGGGIAGDGGGGEV